MKKANHRQSIITNLKPYDVIYKDNTLFLFDYIDFSIAHGNTNYHINVDKQKKEIKTDFDIFWVYVNVDTTSGEVSLKITDLDPTDFGSLLPASAPNKKIYFAITNHKSYIRDVNRWSEVITINLCKISGGKIEKVYSGISQVGLNNSPHTAGTIEFNDNHKPIKVETQHGFRFVTDADLKLMGLQDVKSSNIENIKTKTISSTNIQKHDLLIRTSNYGIIKGTNAAVKNPIIAIALSDCESGKECFIKEQGFITDRFWRWSVLPNTKLYCDSSGRLALTPDWSANSVQEVGYVVDVDTIYFDPKEKIAINSLKSELSA